MSTRMTEPPPATQSSVPIIDFSPFLSSTSNLPSTNPSLLNAQLVTAAEILDGFRTNGFIYLQNISVPPEMVNQAFQWSKRFFELPIETKNEALHPADGACHRGYSPIGLEKVVQAGLPDQPDLKRAGPDHKETFDIGSPTGEPANIWLPDALERSLGLAGIREFFGTFYAACSQLKEEILRALSIGLLGPTEADYLAQFHVQSNSQIRLAHYPSVDRRTLAEGGCERFGAHTDFGTFTVLFQDAVGGLEVESPVGSGTYVPVRPVPGTVVVNVGDLLMRWSNDNLRSTLHRVAPPPGPDQLPARYSIPFFCSPDPGALINCLPGCPRPEKYQPVRAGEYLAMRMKASY